MALETLEPNPVWVADAYADTVDTLEAYGDRVVFKVWCGDWCKDCRAQLPDFGAALEEANVPDDRVEEYELDEDKQGPGVEEYGVEFIPTVVIEHESREVARYVESEGEPIAVSIADQLRESLEVPDEEENADDGEREDTEE